jgi:REP element-mobilizing transposase RayT
MYFKSRHECENQNREQLKQFFITSINQALEIYDFHCIAYLVSNNFFHFIIKTPEEKQVLPQIIRYVQVTFEKLYNKEMNQALSFWDHEFTHKINEIHI